MFDPFHTRAFIITGNIRGNSFKRGLQKSIKIHIPTGCSHKALFSRFQLKIVLEMFNKVSRFQH